MHHWFEDRGPTPEELYHLEMRGRRLRDAHIRDLIVAGASLVARGGRRAVAVGAAGLHAMTQSLATDLWQGASQPE